MLEGDRLNIRRVYKFLQVLGEKRLFLIWRFEIILQKMVGFEGRQVVERKRWNIRILFYKEQIYRNGDYKGKQKKYRWFMEDLENMVKEFGFYLLGNMVILNVYVL